ncbi:MULTISPECIES: sugar-binding transcriptional regulator [unclassified Pseudactinotalea]|uniref:sugar-binding transcriptional regulator n=1 Tax=unclassified Pseudactinotalea TaxID=2649176 RepID=UPI00128D098E|nr:MULTISPECIES: sugar-binding domain-containing protein [unclassified Pseudactinotalea]MPV50445.1 transcriptional regulator [Pseudactinotalea sp. HY160]QGH70530.1 transcriptional regulator [Pseudactinotalea sp. HY158]
MRDLDQAYRAATMYYLQNQKMEVIGATLGISRSTVSRLLTAARAAGIVEVSVTAPAQEVQSLGHRIAATYGVRVHVVPVRRRAGELQRLDQVAVVAAHLLQQWFTDGMLMGVAWGTTISAVARHLTPRSTRDTAVVQLNGAANTSTSGVTYATDLIGALASAFDATTYYFPVPAFFDFEQTKQLMWRERSVRKILQVHERVDLALFGVGSPEAAVPSHVYTAGYLDRTDLDQLERERVVGDVCTVLLREDGSYRDIALNARASGPTPQELRRIRRRVCVVVGETKVRALVGALNARVATDLVIDQTTAQALLDYLAEPGRPGGR